MSRLRRVVAKANQRLTIKLAAGLLAGSTLLSALLGVYRDRLINGYYFDTYKEGVDAYTAAFQIPDFLFLILVSGALSVTFIPVFNQRMSAGNKKSAWELSTSMINLMALLTLVASILIMIFAEPLTYLLAPGFNESAHALTVSMMRVIAVNPFLFSISAVVTSIQQAVGRYSFYALAPALYNVGIIIGAVWLTQGITLFGVEIFEGGIMGVALGVALGGVLQLVVSCLGLIGLGFDYRFKIYWKNKGFRKVLSLLPARSLDQGADYLMSFVETNLASHMGKGAVRAYNQALTLYFMPINLIGVAISTAAFPQMTERLNQGRPDLFRRELQSIIRVIIWLALPVSTITYFARGYVVSFVKNGGNELIAGLLGALVIAILFRTIFHIASRSFYAQQDTKTPLYISIFSIGLNIVLAVWFSKQLGFGPYGLAWAQSIVAVVEVSILFAVMAKRIPQLFDVVFVHAIARMVSATGFMAIICYTSVQLLQLSVSDLSFFATFPKFSLITLISFATYIYICKLMGLEEVQPILKTLRRFFLARLIR